MPTVTGTLQSAANQAAIAGTVEVMLCGYGSRVPRMNGMGLTARITTQEIPVDANSGNFSFTVVANDNIAPAGTFYTVTIKDDNGDIAQVNAYRFTSDANTYDLNLIEPYDPNQPPPPIPPLLVNMLDIIPFSSTPDFDGTQFNAWRMTLNGDVTSITLSNIFPGNLYTFIIQQDGTGSHAFNWTSGNLYNATLVNQDPNSLSIQTFVADENSWLYAIAPGTYYYP
jgi:hypothetical protein